MHFLKRDNFNSKEWKTKFDRIAERDDHRCYNCSSYAEVYLCLALKPPDVPVEELPDEMFTLYCVRCVEATEKHLSLDWFWSDMAETDSTKRGENLH